MFPGFFTLLTLLALLPTLQSQADVAAAHLAQGALEKQKARPFRFHLRSIGFGDVPYVFDVTTTVVKYDGTGKPKPKESGCVVKGVFIPIEAAMFYTPLESCGQSVDAKTRESFESRNKEKLAKVKRRSTAEKAKLQAEEEKQRKERTLFWGEFIKAFQFRIVGRREVNGRPTTMISFNPASGYRPIGAVDTQYLPKLSGQLWVDDADNEIAHLELEFTDNVTAGFGLVGKVSAGTSYFMDLRKQIDDEWLPAKAETVLKSRALLVMKTNEKYTVEYDDYRKFSTEVLIRVVGPEK
jgi:hypothetical protein